LQSGQPLDLGQCRRQVLAQSDVLCLQHGEQISQALTVTHLPLGRGIWHISTVSRPCYRQSNSEPAPSVTSVTTGATATFRTLDATTFGVGFTILGFGGSSQTGYSTEADAKFHYSQNGKICGRHGPPGTDPGQDNAAP
jgi:hypothetical protein